MMAAGADGLFGWADAISRFPEEELLDDPVFEGMESDNGYPSSRRQGADRFREGCLHCF